MPFFPLHSTLDFNGVRGAVFLMVGNVGYKSEVLLCVSAVLAHGLRWELYTVLVTQHAGTRSTSS